jgi:hypothetical protein
VEPGDGERMMERRFEFECRICRPNLEGFECVKKFFFCKIMLVMWPRRLIRDGGRSLVCMVVFPVARSV